jgi:hypothetical protein
MTPEGEAKECLRDQIVIEAVPLASLCGSAVPVRHSGRRAPAVGTEDCVKLDKQELVRMLRTEGDNDTADAVEGRLPDEIDTDQHAGELEAVGLDRTQLMAKLAGGSLGGSVAP